MKRFWVFGFALLAFSHYASAIMCYECNSAKHPACTNARLPDNMRRNCSDLDKGMTHTLCRKIVQHLDHEVNGQVSRSRIIRTCGWDDSKYKTTCYHRVGLGSRQEICTCMTDFCNGASFSTLATILLVNLIMMKIIL